MLLSLLHLAAHVPCSRSGVFWVRRRGGLLRRAGGWVPAAAERLRHRPSERAAAAAAGRLRVCRASCRRHGCMAEAAAVGFSVAIAGFNAAAGLGGCRAFELRHGAVAEAVTEDALYRQESGCACDLLRECGQCCKSIVLAACEGRKRQWGCRLSN